MDIPTLQSFFMWCTILNLGVLIITGLWLTIGADFVYRLHGRFFTISRQTFDIAIYCWIRLLKILVIVFCIVPWIARSIIG